ncbi:ferric reductase-like transmembrane domain-containing protein [Komagataeibacter swingsii]|uniref:Ferric reductase-like transmembrane domain-containing protein n=1 Tax=Komagataeibacter swingsii TaxID=215220 RepID=A0A850NYB2_9PROT|nr:ferric reductase-like transmembrane domain-containing protein [Komagataeibacter swingsii]NVN37327.1 ferric reductase-like transmembrane domain-containing protein [Komagataeibacter swingsii]
MFLILPLCAAYSVLLLCFWPYSVMRLSIAWEASMLCGFSALFFLLTLFALTGRPLPEPFFDGRFFLTLHRWLAWLFVGLVALHAGGIIWVDPQTLYDVWPSGAPGMQFGAAAAALAVVTPCLALQRVRRGLYATAAMFRRSHALLAMAVLGASVFHVVATQVHVALWWQVWMCVGIAMVACVLPVGERSLLARLPTRHGGRRRRLHTAYLARRLAGVMLCVAACETVVFVLWRH